MFRELCYGSLHLLFVGILVPIAPNSLADQDALFIDTDRLDAGLLIDAVLARNASVEAMRAAWQAAEHRVEQASALDDPMLSYSFAPETFANGGRDFGQKVQISQRLPWPGKRALRGESARFEANATEQDIALLQLHLCEAAGKVFADWYYIHAALRINVSNQTLWKEFHTVAELKYSTGLAGIQDALQAEVQQTMLEHQAITLQRKQRNILAGINTLLNREPDEPVPPPAELLEVRDLPDAPTLRERALATHPTLKALNARLRARQTKHALAEREFYPDFNVSAGYNSLWDRDEKRFTVGVGINLPLGRSKRNARASESRALALQTRWQIADEQAAIGGAVQRAYDLVDESRHVVALYRHKLVPLVEETLVAALSGYESGVNSFLDLVSAEKALFDTQLKHLQARTDYHRHLAVLATRVGDPGLLDVIPTSSLTLGGPR